MPDWKALSAIVLAAGLSRRAAPHHKLLLPAPDGVRPVVRATTEAIVGAGFGEVLVVTGHARDRIEAALAGLPVSFVFAPDHARGMGHSLAAGVRAATHSARGFVVVPGDLPLLTAALVRSIAAAYSEGGEREHVIPLCEGRRGHPVIIGAWLRPQLEVLAGDAGARALLAAPLEQKRCRTLETTSAAIVRDVDFAPPG